MPRSDLTTPRLRAELDASPGRPRDPRIDADVLDVTRQLLVEIGYSRLSFELVARRAGVTRPTIYRRWPSKAHLVHAAVFPDPDSSLVADTDDLAADLRTMIRRTLRSYARPEVQAAIPGLLSDLHDDRRLRSAVIDRLENRVRANLADLIVRAVARGEARPDIDADAVLDTIAGALFHRVIARQELSARFADQLADLVLRGVSAR